MPRRAGLGRRAVEAEPDSGARPSRARRRKTSLIGGPRLSARERERERERAGGFGPGRAAGPKRVRGRRGGIMGRAGEEREKRLGRAGRGEKRRKKRIEGGPAQERKRGREKKECNSNDFDFEVEI
jgi:hypothetical protein